MKLNLHAKPKILTCLVQVFLIISLLLDSYPYRVSAEKLSQVDSLLQDMTMEEKVGQLFLVTFNGTDIGDQTKIYDLIVNHHIGGVILYADNNNFSETDILTGIINLTGGLQTLAMQRDPAEPVVIEDPRVPTLSAIPLWIGLEQDGNGYPGDQVLSGLTALPSAMSIGATWDPALALQAGSVLGKELAALGFNLFLGPSLDVVDSNSLNSASLNGTQSFGGDPYWVGQMGEAFISGLHQGSNNQLAVIAKHFPGLGGVDRSPDVEISTVMKSLEQLKQLELAPFFYVTGAASSTDSVADGLLVSHIRYQGFQGNIRATTKPVSLDSMALSELMSLTELTGWRSNGGLMIADDLGSRAVRRFYDPTEDNFESWQVARMAFLAGNDLMLLDNFRATGDLDEYTTILRTIEFFIQKAQEDPLFAQRVDASVGRILESKMTKYKNFDLEDVIPDPNSLSTIGNSSQVSSLIAQNAVTLISPSSNEVSTLLPSPPNMYEYITIFTDVRTTKQCNTCSDQRLLSSTSFQSALLKLYGPQAGNEILQNRLSSYSFSQLNELLNNISEPSDPNLEDNIKRSNWVIFNILNDDPAFVDSTALKRMLSERFDLLQDKHIIVFSYDTPYYLDATELSKITAYYGLYSRLPQFVEVAARILMQEIEPLGSLPVSVSSVGYDLIKATSPDPSQVIPLTLLIPEEQATGTPDPESTLVNRLAMLKIGEVVSVQAGIVLDHNQNPVPDGTIVRFTFRLPGENVIIQQSDVATVNGKAISTYRIERADNLEVTAISEPALISNMLLLNIESGLAEVFVPTNTPAPTPTHTLVPTVTSTISPTPDNNYDTAIKGYPKPSDWFIMMLIVGIGFGLAYLIGYYWWGSARWGIRSGLCAAIGGLVSFIYLNLGTSGTISWMQQSGTWFVIQLALVGIILGWIFALVWWMVKDGSKMP
jgi:beta-N-acetylhexosaminidase